MYQIVVVANGSFKTLAPAVTKEVAFYWATRIKELGGHAIVVPIEAQ